MSRDRDTLKSTEFRNQREGIWVELEVLVEKVENKGIDSLTAEESTRLPMVYRATLSSLGIARSISLDRNVLEYLESLCSRAYFCVYGTRRNVFELTVDFFATSFPQKVRNLRWHVLLSGALLILGGAAAWAMFVQDPEFFYAFVPEHYAQGRGPGASTEELRAILFDDGGGGHGQLANFASWLMSHNARIGMMCFALGIGAGIPVVYLLFNNGGVLGAFGALYHDRGLGLEFWSWVLPHGITELLAVVLCGAAGLAIGEALIFPGKYDRVSNMVERGKDAGVVVLGAVLMFIVAALVEGFFRQVVHDVPVRYLMAVSTATFWVAYFGLVGHEGGRR